MTGNMKRPFSRYLFVCFIGLVIMAISLTFISISHLTQTSSSKPQLSMFIGGAGVDDCDAIAVDINQNIYLGCHSTSEKLAKESAHHFKARSGMNAFVIKLSPNAVNFDYISHLGGAKWEAVQGLVVDDAGNAFAVGTTYSDDFPVTEAAFQASFGGKSDAFVTKIDPEGVPVWTTFLGGIGDEDGRDIVLGKNGEVHVIGRTDSKDFPITRKAFQTEFGGETDVFLATLNSDGDLLASTYIGGEGRDIGIALAIDSQDKIYLTGSTGSVNFPVHNGVQKDLVGEDDVFVAVLDSSRSHLEFSSYLGGSARERGAGIGLSSTGDVIVVGQTASTDLAVTSNAMQSQLNGETDAFVASLNIVKSEIRTLTYLGGEKSDRPRDLVMDGSNKAIIVGQAASRNFLNSFVASFLQNKDDDAFLTVLNTDVMEIIFSSVQSGNKTDVYEAAAWNFDGSITVTGLTGSKNFPTTDLQQSSYQGGKYDIILSQFDLPFGNISP